MVLKLWGSCTIFTEATGLSCTVDLTQSVQRLALSVLQQICLALRVRQRKLQKEQRGRKRILLILQTIFTKLNAIKIGTNTFNIFPQSFFNFEGNSFYVA